MSEVCHGAAGRRGSTFKKELGTQEAELQQAPPVRLVSTEYADRAGSEDGWASLREPCPGGPSPAQGSAVQTGVSATKAERT